MTIWIKICGMTTPEAVTAALEAGADAIGFVFAESSRRVTPAMAARLATPARGRVICTAVTRHPTQQSIDEIVAVFAPDLLQTDADDLAGLRLPRQLALLPVFRGSPTGDSPLPPRLLFEGPVSGSGVGCDWSSARQVARRAELVLAGGLNAGNVATAIVEVEPFGVDVSSGVEARPGIKSPAEIARFVTAVRSVRVQPCRCTGDPQGAPRIDGEQAVPAQKGARTSCTGDPQGAPRIDGEQAMPAQKETK